MGKRVSHRIDLAYHPADRDWYKKLIDRFGFGGEASAAIKIFGFAFDFEGENLKKINLYFRNRFG
jgi:hypothetical protein